MGAAGECHTSHGVTWNTVKLMSLTTGKEKKQNNKKTKTSHLIMPLGGKKQNKSEVLLYRHPFFSAFVSFKGLVSW